MASGQPSLLVSGLPEETELGLVGKEGWEMLAACPSRDKIIPPDWELGRKGAPISSRRSWRKGKLAVLPSMGSQSQTRLNDWTTISLAKPAQIKALWIDFHSIGVVMEQVMFETPDSSCSYQDLEDFLKFLLLHSLCTLGIIYRQPLNDRFL